MVGPCPEERADTALVTVLRAAPTTVAVADVITAPTVPITPAAPVTSVGPVPAVGPPAGTDGRPDTARRPGTPLPAVGGEFLSAALDLLCRDRPLSRAEIGDHADVVAEVADALAAVADRLVRDLDALGPDAAGSSGLQLSGARDALHEGSADSRRGAAQLWARHISELRASVDRVRPDETPEITASGEAPAAATTSHLRPLRRRSQR